MKLTDKELYWLAGILEGEGYFGLRSDDRKTLQVKVEMTDEDIVLRIAHLVGKLTNKYHDLSYVSRRDKLHVNDTCVLALYGKDAKTLMKNILPIMGSRRRKKIWQSLNGHFERKPKAQVSKEIDISELLQSNVIKIARRF